MLTDFFYPNANVGAHRATQLCKYLPRSGWNPVIITTECRRDNCLEWDPELDFYLPSSIPIYRVPMRHHYRNSIQQFFSDLIYFGKNPRVFSYRALELFTPRLSYLNPPKYYFGALSLVRKTSELKKVDLIWATGPSFNNFVLAKKISEEIGKPWVADFRDSFDQPWTVKSYAKREVLKRKESTMMESASLLITVSQNIAHDLSKKHGKKVYVLPNGYDNSFFYNTDPLYNEKLTVVYTGRIHASKYNAEIYFSGLSLFLQNKPSVKMVTVFYGDNSEIIEDLVRRYPNTKGYVKCYGQKPYRQSLRAQQSADILLHFTVPNYKGVLTGKIFEYIAARKNILCVPGDCGEVEDVLQDAGLGWVSRDDVQVSSKLTEFYSFWSRNRTLGTAPNNDFIRRFSRQTQAESLAKQLDTLVEKAD